MGRSQFFFDAGVLLRMFVLETEVLEFGLDFVQAKTVGQWSVDVKRLTRNFILFVGWLRLQCAHIMQAVANLDENDADILTHGEQQFLEVLCLC